MPSAHGMHMGLKDFFFGGNAGDKATRQRDKMGQRLNGKNTLHEDRVGAIEALTQDGSSEAAWLLIKRFDWSTEKLHEDQTEKEYVTQALEERLGPVAATTIRRFVQESPNISLAVQSWFRICPEEEVVAGLLETLAFEEKKNSFNPDKKTRLLDALRGHPHPSLVEAITPLLHDFDDPVRHAAVEVLLEQDDPRIPQLLLNALLRPEEESQRIRSRILHGFSVKGWPVGEAKARILPLLDRGQAVDGDGRIVTGGAS